MSEALREPAEEQLKVENFNHIVGSGLLIIVLLVGGFIAWTILAKLSGAVIAPGAVKVDLNRKTVQHREGGIVQDILVREGDKVREGQALVLMADSQIDSSAAIMDTQFFQMLARMARLDAQRQFAPAISWPADLQAKDLSREAREAMAAEENIFREERRVLSGQTGMLQQQILGMQAQVQAEDRIISAYEEELAAKSALQRERYLEKTPVLDLQRNQANHQSVRSVTVQKIAETNLRIAELRKDYVQRSTAQFADIQARVAELRERKRPFADAKSRLMVTAPVSGTVMDITVFTKGAVLRPGERLMDIVPDDNRLVIEADIQVKDIAKVHVGQKANIQISAYTHDEVPPLPGEVVYVSPDRTTTHGPHGDTPVYKIRATISRDDLARHKAELTAGMPAIVFVLTKEKTVMGYLIEPFVDHLSHAMRE